MLALLANIATFIAGLGSAACFTFWADEPECPKSLIK